MINIGIDIDCVLANSIDLFIPFLNEKFKKNLTIDDIKHYEFSKCYGISGNEVLEAFKELTEKKMWMNIEPTFFANEFLLKLKKNDFNSIIITSRPEQHMKSLTENWLKKHNLSYDKLLFMDEKIDKDKFQTALRNNIKLDLFIEDCPEFADNMVKYEIPILIYDYPFNQIVNKKIKRIFNLKEALEFIKNNFKK